MRSSVFLASIAMLMSACASPQGIGPSADRAADLSGRWSFQVATPAGVANGQLNVTKEAERYGGTLTTDQGNQVLKVRTLTLERSAMRLAVESPNGDVTFQGRVSGDRRSFNGTVTYFNGQQFPMAGVKR